VNVVLLETKNMPLNILLNKTRIHPKNFKENGIVKFDIETQSHFEAPHKNEQEIYLAPHIVIKEMLGKNSIPIVSFWIEMQYSIIE